MTGVSDRRHGRRNRRKRAGMQDGLLSDQEDDDDSDSEDLSEMEEAESSESDDEAILGGGAEGDDEEDDAEERRRRLRLRRERLRRERMSKVQQDTEVDGLERAGSFLMSQPGFDMSRDINSRICKTNVSQHSRDAAPLKKGDSALSEKSELRRRGSFLAMGSEKREKAASIYCSSNSLIARKSSMVFCADENSLGFDTPDSQNSQPAAQGSSKTKGWFRGQKSGSNNQSPSLNRSHSGHKLFRSFSAPTVK